MEEKTENTAAPKPERIVQNGVTRPLSHTLCGRAWDMADAMSKAKGAPVAVADLLVETNKEGLNEANVKAEYSRWRKFHGVTGRIPSQAALAKIQEREAAKAKAKEDKEAKAKAKAEEKARKEAEKAAAKQAKEEEKAAKAAEKAAKEAAKKAAAEDAKAGKAAE